MKCAGSVNLIESMPDHDSTKSAGNFAAREGNCAHLVASESLKYGPHDPSQHIDAIFYDVTVTEEMVENVRPYIDHALAIMRIPGIIYWIERKFTLAALQPPRPMFGTSDFSAYDPATRTLYVSDLKYGQGVMVEIKQNEQTRYYALGVLLTLDPVTQPVERVVMHIVQPRKEHEDGVVRDEVISIDQLWLFAGELIEAARATTDPHAPLSAGDHCRFCPAKPVCPEIYKQSQEIAATEFDTMPAVLPPPPATLSREEFAGMLSKLHLLDDWSDAMWAHAEAEIRAGREVPGFKMVERRAERKWVDAAEATKIILDNTERDESHIMESKLKSPAQIEKLVGKAFVRDQLSGHVVKKSSGLKLVPDTHPSPAVSLTPGSEFELLPATTSDDKAGNNENE
jgi:hypothetical protein